MTEKQQDRIRVIVLGLFFFCLLTGCAKEKKQEKREKLDVSAYYESTGTAFREMNGLIGKSEDEIREKFGAGRDEKDRDTYEVTVFGRKESVTVDYKPVVSTDEKRQVLNFKIFLNGDRQSYIDYDEALTAVFGAPVSSDQSPYEGNQGVTRWNNYNPGSGGEVRLCHSKNGEWIVVQKAE